LKTKSTAPQKGGPANPKWQSSLAQSDEADSPQVTPKVTIQPGPLGPSTATAADATIEPPTAAGEFNRLLKVTSDADKFDAAVTIQIMVAGVKAIREIRDKGLFHQGGFRSFRHWCVSHFGERFGTWLETTI
jgi:hypothetical protein